MDKILIRDILVRCIIGVKDEERREKQDVIINVAIDVDLRKPGLSDDFRDTIDYRGVKKRIVAMVETSGFFLLEALAQKVADICLEHPMAVCAQVTVESGGVPPRVVRERGVAVHARIGSFPDHGLDQLLLESGRKLGAARPPHAVIRPQRLRHAPERDPVERSLAGVTAGKASVVLRMPILCRDPHRKKRQERIDDRHDFGPPRHRKLVRLRDESVLDVDRDERRCVARHVRASSIMRTLSSWSFAESATR